MKRCIATILAFVLMISLSGCKTGSHDVYEEIYERYYNMKSFSAVAEVTVKSDKTENRYVVKQLYEAPDSFLIRVVEPKELEGSGVSLQGDQMILNSGFGHNEAFGGKLSAGHGVLFVSDFFETYFKSEETSVSAATSKGDSVTVLECFLGGKNEKRFMQKLWIDNETFLPLKLETYDINQNPSVTVSFREFQRNYEIDPKNFK
ncbi:MAG: outer membrane lipoprotein carrier protein LolA [Clostridia bacterium]|nr:outer membrane lipoprotein carrier protein LolA [Clostridia bacterium]